MFVAKLACSWTQPLHLKKAATLPATDFGIREPDCKLSPGRSDPGLPPLPLFPRCSLRVSLLDRLLAAEELLGVDENIAWVVVLELTAGDVFVADNEDAWADLFCCDITAANSHKWWGFVYWSMVFSMCRRVNLWRDRYSVWSSTNKCQTSSLSTADVNSVTKSSKLEGSKKALWPHLATTTRWQSVLNSHDGKSWYMFHKPGVNRHPEPIVSSRLFTRKARASETKGTGMLN